MAALTADRPRNIRGTPQSGPPMTVAASTTLYGGSLLSINAAGDVIPAADTASTLVVGVCPEFVDNSAGSAGDKTVSPQFGHSEAFEIVSTSLTKADIDLIAVVSTDQDLTDATTATNDIAAGKVVGIEDGKVWIHVGNKAGTAAP